MECIDCLKENDSILGIYNVAHYVKTNNGKLKYINDINKGTKVMFSFWMENCKD